MNDPIQITSFNQNLGKKPHVVLICAHDGDHEIFLRNNPELTELYKKVPELFEKYLKLERDNGAKLFSEKTAQLLAKSGKYRIDLIYVANIPRGVIDLNRAPKNERTTQAGTGKRERAIRYIFSYTKNPVLYQRFKKIHKQAVGMILDCLQKLDPVGIFMDIHTMNDHDPAKTVRISPGRLSMAKFVHDLTDPKNALGKRRINLITGLKTESSVAHPALEDHIKVGFAKKRFQISFNRPYALHPWTMLNKYMHKFPQRGIGIDLPVYTLSAPGQSCNISPVFDPGKIEKIAVILSDAVIKSLPQS